MSSFGSTLLLLFEHDMIVNTVQIIKNVITKLIVFFMMLNAWLYPIRLVGIDNKLLTLQIYKLFFNFQHKSDFYANKKIAAIKV